MDGDAVKEIVTRARGPVEIGGFIVRPNDWAADDPAALIKPGPTAKTLTTATLQAIRDYIKANRDSLDVSTLLVHIAGPSSVVVLGPLSHRARVRETYVAAACTDLTDNFLGRFMSLEEFLVGIQVRFVDGLERGRLLSLLSNVKSETVKTALDDGVTQVVQARNGVALVSEVAVPNPVHLAAYRTFRDVQQPDALFVVRVVGGKAGGLPEVGLFEADGGAWRLTSIARIREWLVAELPDIAVLA